MRSEQKARPPILSLPIVWVIALDGQYPSDIICSGRARRLPLPSLLLKFPTLKISFQTTPFEAEIDTSFALKTMICSQTPPQRGNRDLPYSVRHISQFFSLCTFFSQIVFYFPSFCKMNRGSILYSDEIGTFTTPGDFLTGANREFGIYV